MAEETHRLVLCSDGLRLRSLIEPGYQCRLWVNQTGLVVQPLNRWFDKSRSYFLPLIAHAMTHAQYIALSPKAQAALAQPQETP